MTIPGAGQVYPHVHRKGMLRRELLQVGFLGAFGLSMESAFAPRAEGATGKAKRIIVVWMPGGPPQMQLWDVKPDSPSQCRGTAKPISTSADGVQIGSRLPLTARQAHRFCIARTLSLNAEDENHIPGHLEILAGLDKRPSDFKFYATRNDWPSMGSVISALRPNTNGLPAAVHLPLRIRFEGQNVPGCDAGWLGSRYDPWFVEQDPNNPRFAVPDITPLPGLTVERLDHRRRLLSQVDDFRRDLDRDLGIRQLSDVQQRAFGLATSAETRQAFDLSREPETLRERYGRHTWGQSLLLGRRLAEAGVKYVQVNLGGLNTWDYHSQEDRLMDAHMPPFDRGFSTLLEDLAQRGMLEDTLVFCTSEMGRNPVLGRAVTGAAMNAAEPDGRNHWQWVWSGVFAGAGIRGGSVVGETDAWAGHPETRAIMPADVVATLYHAMGIHPRTEVHDIQGRPMAINAGEVVKELFA